MPPRLDHHRELQACNHPPSDLYIPENDHKNTPTKAAPKNRDRPIKNEPTHKRILYRDH